MTKIENIKKWIKNKAGVSPIIAIILMVAITVVLAATIYVWVSGMGGGGGTKIALSMSQIDVKDDGASGDYVEYRVDSVSGGPGWEDIKILVGGTVAWDGTSAQNGYAITVDGTAIAAGAISPGQIIKITDSGSADLVDVGDSVTIIDIDSGQVIWSADIQY